MSEIAFKIQYYDGLYTAIEHLWLRHDVVVGGDVIMRVWGVLRMGILHDEHKGLDDAYERSEDSIRGPDMLNSVWGMSLWD